MYYVQETGESLWTGTECVGGKVGDDGSWCLTSWDMVKK